MAPVIGAIRGYRGGKYRCHSVVWTSGRGVAHLYSTLFEFFGQDVAQIHDAIITLLSLIVRYSRQKYHLLPATANSYEILIFGLKNGVRVYGAPEDISGP